MQFAFISFFRAPPPLPFFAIPPRLHRSVCKNNARLFCHPIDVEAEPLISKAINPKTYKVPGLNLRVAELFTDDVGGGAEAD